MGVDVVINIDVPDIDSGAAFYTSGLGFRLNRLLFDGGVAELSGHGAAVYLIAQPAGSAAVPGADAIRRYAPHWTPVHLDIRVDDIIGAAAQAEKAGATRHGPITQHPFGALARLRDPFGHGFCLIEFAEGGYDNVTA